VFYTDKGIAFDMSKEMSACRDFEARLAEIPSEHRQIVLEMYANPVNAKLQILNQ